MKNIEMKIKDLSTDGVSTISLVQDPAIQKNFICLSKKKLAFKEVNKKRQILMGVALSPDQKILRENEKGEKYSIWFSKKTVREISELFLQNGFQDQINLEHMTPVSGATVVESWIKEDKVHDKSVLHKLDAKVGDWIVSMKVKDKKLYDLALTGAINGFSIEGLFEDDSSDLSDQETINAMAELINSNS